MTQSEEFEAWLAIAKSNRSHMPSISDLMFEAWQAAKTQAVPQWIPVNGCRCQQRRSKTHERN